jgi:hypothetical protein
MYELPQASKANKKRMAPKSGGRGTRDKDKPSDKTVRITSVLYEEMMEFIRRKHYNADFYDIGSEVWEYYKSEHKKRHG